MIHNDKIILPKELFIAFIHFSEVFRPRLCDAGEQFLFFTADKAFSHYIIDKFSSFGVTITISEFNSNEYVYAISK